MHTHQKGKKKSAFSFNGKRKTDDWIQSGEQDMRRQSWVFGFFFLFTDIKSRMALAGAG